MTKCRRDGNPALRWPAGTGTWTASQTSWRCVTSRRSLGGRTSWQVPSAAAATRHRVFLRFRRLHADRCEHFVLIWRAACWLLQILS